MSPILHIAATWTAWVLLGVLYDPVVAPRAKNGAPHHLLRALVMFAYCRTLELWVAISQRWGKPVAAFDGLTLGELLASLFVIQSRRWLRQVTAQLLPWGQP